MAQLSTWFATVDVDRSGHINSTELQRALAMGGLNFSLAICQQMIRMHDRDGSGTISYNEFESLHNFIMNSQNAFYYFDRDRSGHLSVEEVQQGLAHMGYRFDQPSFVAVVRSFDPDRNGKFSLPEFLAMSMYLQCASNVFRSFDPSGSGRINLDFNQFLYASANCR